MKKFVPYLLTAAVCGLLCACGNDETAENSVAETTEAVTTAVTTTSVTTSAAVTENTTTTTAVTTAAEKKKKSEEAPEEKEEEEREAAEEVVEEQAEENEAAVESSGYFSDADLYAYYGGYSLTVNQDIATCPAAMSVDSSPSCYYDGEDKIFHYGDMDIYTYPSGGKDYILEITFISGNISTARGLSVGMTVDDAIAMYGAGVQGGGSGMYTWYSGSSYLYITSSDGIITSIGIGLQN